MDTINGHFEILDKARPIEDIIGENESEELTRKLKEFQQARKFATDVLLLPSNDSYKEYADIGRPFAVWNVIAAPALSVQPKKWCFIFVGCISYRGYFNKQDAELYAEELRKQGFDVYVAGARAYSTLGWFDDPLLNTMMYKSESARVGILFHELAHQKFYIDDDSAFNEAFATTIEQEGVKRWFRYKQNNNKLTEFEKHLIRRKEFSALLLHYRNVLKILYTTKSSKEFILSEKKKIFKEIKQDYTRLKRKWNGYDGYDKWMNQDLNNAHLALVSTYNDLVPIFSKKFNESQSISDFYEYIVNLSNYDIKKRKMILNY